MVTVFKVLCRNFLPTGEKAGETCKGAEGGGSGALPQKMFGLLPCIFRHSWTVSPLKKIWFLSFFFILLCISLLEDLMYDNVFEQKLAPPQGKSQLEEGELHFSMENYPGTLLVHSAHLLVRPLSFLFFFLFSLFWAQNVPILWHGRSLRAKPRCTFSISNVPTKGSISG